MLVSNFRSELRIFWMMTASGQSGLDHLDATPSFVSTLLRDAVPSGEGKDSEKGQRGEDDHAHVCSLEQAGTRSRECHPA